MPDLEDEEIIGSGTGSVIGSADGFTEGEENDDGTEITVGGEDVGGFDPGDEDDTPAAISQSTWYEKVYEDEENAETASHLVM